MPRRVQGLPEHFHQHKTAVAKRIGARTHQWRMELDLIQDDVLARVELNEVHISRTQFSRIENGQLLPNVVAVMALAEVLKVTAGWLLLDDEEADTWNILIRGVPTCSGAASSSWRTHSAGTLTS